MDRVVVYNRVKYNDDAIIPHMANSLEKKAMLLQPGTVGKHIKSYKSIKVYPLDLKSSSERSMD